MAEPKRAKVFWTGRSQAVRLPKEFRFDEEVVAVRREGNSIILEPLDEWPDDYLESFVDESSDIERPEQGELPAREPL